MSKEFLFAIGLLCCLAAACGSPAEQNSAHNPGDSGAVSLGSSAAGATDSSGAGDTAKSTGPTPTIPWQDPYPADDGQRLLGYYVGGFQAEEYRYDKRPSYNNRINLAIEFLQDEVIKGYTVVAGNKRPFEGTYTIANGKYEVTATEPGDNRYDGKFQFSLTAATRFLKGTWHANDPKLAVPVRNYELEFTTFSYNPKLGLEDLNYPVEVNNSQEKIDGSRWREAITRDAGKYNASVQRLKPEDIENMRKGDLEVMRNAIYARHGYSFQNRKMRYFFDGNVHWYVPMSVDVTRQLTALEQENIDLIKRYEEHAEAYYDKFGR